MSDRELLELAAKATGHCYSWSDKYECLETWRDGDKIKRFWQPHRDDGDALRLAVKLGISVFSPDCAEYHNDGDVYASVRLAIVRAAAEIGKRSNVPHQARAIASRPECGCSASSIGGEDNG